MSNAARWGTLAAVAVLVLAGTAPLTPSAWADPPPPVPASVSCAASTVYLSENSPTSLYRVGFGVGTAPVSTVGAPAAVTYNALGDNPANGYLYAVETLPSSGHILRINPATGAVTDLGATTPALTGGTWNSGTFDSSGRFYVDDSTSATLDVVDVATLSMTPLTLSASPGAADLTPGPGSYLWGATGNSAPAGEIVRVDRSSGQVDFFPAPAAMAHAASYGGAFTFGNGDLGLVYNGGELYQLAIANPAATPVFTLLSADTTAGSATVDGTSCVSPPTDLQVTLTGPARVAPGARMTWALRVTDNGPAGSSGFSLTDAIPAGYTAATVPVGCTVSGADVSCTGDGLAVGASVTISITATAPAPVQCLTNSVTVVGNEAEPGTAHDVADNSAQLVTCVGLASLTVLKRVSSVTELVGDGLTVAGDLIRYSIVATNTGAVALDDVTIADTLGAPAGPPVRLRCTPALPVPVLAAGASVTCGAS